MPKPRIYLDTTIPSAYHTNRTDAGAVERRAHTHRWWNLAALTSEFLISDAVLQDFPMESLIRSCSGWRWWRA